MWSSTAEIEMVYGIEMNMNARIITEPRKFTTDVIWVAVSGILAALTGLITLPVLTKAYSSEIYGVWMQVWVTLGLLTPVLLLHLSTSTVRFLAGEEDRKRRRRAFSAMLLPVLTFGCLVLAISVFLKQELSVFLFTDLKYVSFIPLTFLWTLGEVLFSFSSSYLRARGRIKRLAVIRLARSVARMALIVALAMTGYSLGWIITCLIAVEAIFAGMVFGIIIKEIGFPTLNFEGLKGYLAFSIPQIPSGALLWIINASDRYFITHLLNLSQTGIYSASYTLGSLLTLLYVPIGFVLFPTVSKLWERKELSTVKSYFEYSAKIFLAVAIPAAAGLYILSQPLLSVLTTSEFLAGGLLVLLVALGTIFLGIYQINVYIILLVQQTKWLPLMIGIASFTNATINLALIPKVGILGAAISTIISYFVLAAIVTIWARRTLSYKIDFKFLSKVVLATVLMAFGLQFIEIEGVLGIIIAVVTGVMIFGLGFFLSKAYSKEDIRLIRETIFGQKPKL